MEWLDDDERLRQFERLVWGQEKADSTYESRVCIFDNLDRWAWRDIRGRVFYDPCPSDGKKVTSNHDG